MIRKILFASAATAAIAIAATPAAAQQVCEVNGTSTTAGTSTGSYSVVCGSGSNDGGAIHTVIVGQNSTVPAGTFNDVTLIGYGTIGNASDIVIGAHSTATNVGGGNTVVGSSSNATGTANVVVGLGSNDGGFTNSVALGAFTANTASNQVAIGNRTLTQVAAGTIGAGSTDAVNGGQINTIVTNQAATDAAQNLLIAAAASGNPYFDVNSIGAPAVATGTDAIAIGQGATANGTNSIAIGNGASNGGFANSVAIGGFTNTAANQVRVGGSTAATARTVTGVAAGTTTYDAVNFGQLTATNNRVTALEAMSTDFTNQIATLDNRVDKVYKRGKAGTAVAIAMSGNGFLPDKKINVTGNLGFYSGAYAAALQVGAILTDSIAFNAGVARGFNDGGKMGARAGFTLGW